MQTVRTTIRISKELLNQSRLIALRRDTSVQEVINEALAKGFGHITDFDIHEQAMTRIDKFRNSLKGRKINLKKILQESKKDLR